MNNPAPPPALRLRGLRKSFDRPAVDGLELTIAQGEFYALLGPNGAGKTTSLRMVAGLLVPDAGSIEVYGIDALTDPLAARQVTAWLRGEPLNLSPREFQILLELAREPGQVRPKAELAQRLQPLGEPLTHSALEVHVSNLRQKIGAERIQTLRGIGYRLLPDAPP